ncbi:MAG: hypothetical protein EA347_06220 [Thioalkalivibrio sp.]|nr:MAG: hypothetical protein EA347_06220 [Thioalkalivibrio sp.]
MLLLIVILTALAVLVVAFLGGVRERGFRERRILLIALMLPIVVLLVWLAVMVLGVGPGLRGM